MAQIHNLSEGVQESFEFSIKGHEYSFRHLTTEQVEEMQKMQGDELMKFMFQFITKKNDASPDFTVIAKQMIVPEWANFTKMVKAEFGS